MAEFNRGNLHAQVVGSKEKMAVQIATRMGSMSGGQTALTVGIQAVEDSVMVEIGQQAWLGVAASLGQTAWTALRNPFSLLGRLDDIAQDIESIQLSDRVWQVIDKAVVSAGASHALSERLQRVTCGFCGRRLLYLMWRAAGRCTSHHMFPLRICGDNRRDDLPELQSEALKRFHFGHVA
jgi:hypothetical protein